MNYWSISSKYLCDLAPTLWLEVEIIAKNKNLFFIKWNWKIILFKSTDFWWNSSLWLKLADDKELTYRILEKYNLPTAKSYYLNNEDIDTIDTIDFNYPLVIKPLSEWHGNWVMTNILSIEELKKKAIESFTTYNRIVIQNQIQWEEHRILVFKWRIIMAITRMPAHVIWDWVKNIAELIEYENTNNPLRWSWYSKTLTNILIDDELIWYIEKQGLTMDSVPKNREHIQLRWNSNMWTGGTVIDILDKLSQSIKDVAIKWANSLWLELAGVDIMTTDYTKSLKETNGIILEINATPAIWSMESFLKVSPSEIILKELFFS